MPTENPGIFADLKVLELVVDEGPTLSSIQLVPPVLVEKEQGISLAECSLLQGRDLDDGRGRVAV